MSISNGRGVEHQRMAQIKGVEIRGYRLLQGEDRDGFIGFIFINGEKVGSILEPPTEEPMKFKIAEDKHKIMLNQIAIDYYNENPATIKGVIPFFNELSELNLLEDAFVEERKEGASCVVLLRYSRRTDRVDEIFNAPRERLVALSEGVDVNELIKAYNPLEYSTYSKASDFIIN